MLLPVPQLLETALDEVSAETRVLVRRFVEARSPLIDANSGLSTSKSAPDETHVTPVRMSANKQAEYDRYFAVERSEVCPAETLARAALESFQEVSLNAATGHSLTPIEEHLLGTALREGLAMLCAARE
jgi:hypothetical protein